MKRFLSFLAAGVLLAVCATNSSAATSGPFTTSTPIPSTLTDWSSSLAFPQFNPSLGNLVSVQLDLSATFTTTLTVQNNSPSGSAGWAKTELQFTVQDVGNNLNVPELDLYSPIFNSNLGAGQQEVSGLLSKSGSNSQVYTLAAVLAEFTGVGSITLPGSTFTQTLLSNTGGNTDASQITDASLTGDVIYTYTVVPEPSAFGLLALGLGALPLLWRQRQ